MAIDFEIRPSRPQNWLLLEILSKFALALAQEGLQTAPRPSVFSGPKVFFLVRTKKTLTGPKKHLPAERSGGPPEPGPGPIY